MARLYAIEIVEIMGESELTSCARFNVPQHHNRKLIILYLNNYPRVTLGYSFVLSKHS